MQVIVRIKCRIIASLHAAIVIQPRLIMHLIAGIICQVVLRDAAASLTTSLNMSLVAGTKCRMVAQQNAIVIKMVPIIMVLCVQMCQVVARQVAVTLSRWWLSTCSIALIESQ